MLTTTMSHPTTRLTQTTGVLTGLYTWRNSIFWYVGFVLLLYLWIISWFCAGFVLLLLGYFLVLREFCVGSV